MLWDTILFSIPRWLAPLVFSAIHKTLIFLKYIFIYSYGTFFKAFYWFMLFICHLQVTVPALVIFLIYSLDFCCYWFLKKKKTFVCCIPELILFAAFFFSIHLIRKLGPITCLSKKVQNQWLWCYTSDSPSFRNILMIFQYIYYRTVGKGIEDFWIY